MRPLARHDAQAAQARQFSADRKRLSHQASGDESRQPWRDEYEEEKLIVAHCRVSTGQSGLWGAGNHIKWSLATTLSGKKAKIFYFNKINVMWKMRSIS